MQYLREADGSFDGRGIDEAEGARLGVQPGLPGLQSDSAVLRQDAAMCHNINRWKSGMLALGDERRGEQPLLTSHCMARLSSLQSAAQVGLAARHCSDTAIVGPAGCVIATLAARCSSRLVLVRTLTYQKRKILKPYVMKEEGLKKGENALFRIPRLVYVRLIFGKGQEGSNVLSYRYLCMLTIFFG